MDSVRLPEVAAPVEPEPSAEAGAVVLTSYDAPVTREEDQRPEDPGEVCCPQPAKVYDEGLTIETLEQLALANNPVVGQAAARVRASGMPVLLQDSQAVCAPNGTGVIVAVTQVRVRGM